MRIYPIGGELINPDLAHVDSFRELLHDEALRGQSKGWDLPFDAPQTLLNKHIAELDHTHFWWLDQKVVVGRVRLRDVTEGSFYESHGDVGYEVRPTHQRRGYATMMLQNLLNHASSVGRNHLLITCKQTNEPSRRVIEKCGGSFRDIYERDFLRFDFKLS